MWSLSKYSWCSPAERAAATQIFGFGSALGKLVENPLLYQKIGFSDEAHFWLNGYVYKQNCRFWIKDQPEELQKLPMHPEKVTVCCGLWAGGIIGPYFFKDAANRNVTVNGQRYREMISNFFWPICKSLTCRTCMISTRRCPRPHSTRNNGLIERRVR